MIPELPPEDLIAEIDAVHLRVRESFRRRDLAAYMATCAQDLAFHQADGRLLSREKLSRSVARQFARLISFDSGFDRQTARLMGTPGPEPVRHGCFARCASSTNA